MTDKAPTPTIIKVHVRYAADDRGDHYAGVVEKFGFTVYARAEEELEPRIEEAIMLWIGAFGRNVPEVLDSFSRKGIGHTLRYPHDNAGQGLKKELDVPMEIGA